MRDRLASAIALFCVIGILVLEAPAHALGSPVTLADCTANASDCCNPACRSSMSACCVANQCSLPVAGPSGTVFGKAGFQGQSVSCGASIEQCTDECNVTAKGCKVRCCVFRDGFCSKSCMRACARTESTCVDGCRDLPGTFIVGAFAETATVKQEGRLLMVSGPFKCQEGALATVEVRVTESSTGALGGGATRVKCVADEIQFTLPVRVVSGQKFGQVGMATACGTARIQNRGKRLDSFQWCRDVVLLPEGTELRD